MTGIQYIIDSNGKQTAVIIDLKKWGALWKDFQDAMVVKKRSHEPRESIASVRAHLKKSGKLAK
jgi:hypothetical protein